MKLIRNLLAIIIAMGIFMSCNSCDTLCLDGGDDTPIQIEVPFQISPQKEVYQIGDTITLSLFMDEFYSISTNESLPIKENLIKDYVYYFLDTTGYKQPPNPFYSIDSFDFILDSHARKFYPSNGNSAIVFYGNYDKEKQKISFISRIIPKTEGFYILLVGWSRSSRNPNLTDLTDECGKEYYILESVINQGERGARNVHLVEKDTALLRKTMDGAASELSVDSVLNLPNYYYFYVEK